MINISPQGRTAFVKAITNTITSAHLYTEQSELDGNGYTSKPIESNRWLDGDYPELVWEFSAGAKQRVMGYFVRNDAGDLLFSEDFSEPYIIQHNGDRIGVSIRLNLLGTI